MSKGSKWKSPSSNLVPLTNMVDRHDTQLSTNRIIALPASPGAHIDRMSAAADAVTSFQDADINTVRLQTLRGAQASETSAQHEHLHCV